MIVGTFLILVTLGLAIYGCAQQDQCPKELPTWPSARPKQQVHYRNHQWSRSRGFSNGVCKTAGQGFDGVNCVAKPSKEVCAAKNLDFDGKNCLPKAGTITTSFSLYKQWWDVDRGQIMYSDKKCRGPGSVAPAGVHPGDTGRRHQCRPTRWWWCRTGASPDCQSQDTFH